MVKKYISQEMRQEIERGREEGKSLNQLSQEFEIDKTTLSRRFKQWDQEVKEELPENLFPEKPEENLEEPPGVARERLPEVSKTKLTPEAERAIGKRITTESEIETRRLGEWEKRSQQIELKKAEADAEKERRMALEQEYANLRAQLLLKGDNASPAALEALEEIRGELSKSREAEKELRTQLFQTTLLGEFQKYQDQTNARLEKLTSTNLNIYDLGSKAMDKIESLLTVAINRFGMPPGIGQLLNPIGPEEATRISKLMELEDTLCPGCGKVIKVNISTLMSQVKTLAPTQSLHGTCPSCGRAIDFAPLGRRALAIQDTEPGLKLEPVKPPLNTPGGPGVKLTEPKPEPPIKTVNPEPVKFSFE